MQGESLLLCTEKKCTYCQTLSFFNPVKANQHNVSNSVFLCGGNAKLIIYCPVTNSNLNSGVSARMEKAFNTICTVPKNRRSLLGH